MSWQTDAAVGAAQRLNDLSIGTWDQAGATGNIYRGAIPPGVCPGIGIQTYRVGPDNPAHPSTDLRIQFMLRAANIDALNELDQQIYDAFLGLNNVDFGDAHVTDCNSISAISQPPDSNGNPERACNYKLELDLPATALRSY